MYKRQIKQLGTEAEKAVFDARIELAQEAAAIESANLQKQIDLGAIAFQAGLDLQQAKLDVALAQQAETQRSYIEKTKAMRLSEIEEEDRQNKLRLKEAESRKEALSPADSIGAAQVAADIERLNATIAASTQKRAKAEAEALQQVLQLEAVSYTHLTLPTTPYV